MPARNLISIIGACLVGAWFGFGVIERLNNIETKLQLMEKDLEAANTFIDGAWATPTSGFVSADTAVLLIGIFAFYAAEGKRLQMKLWGVYFPLTFLISLAFSFGAFMFMRERTINGD